MIRNLLGFAVSLCAVLLLMPSFIQYLKKLSLKQSVSEYALEDDKKKAGTPIMGGILFIVVPIIVTFIVMPKSLHDFEMWMVILAFIGYGLIGFIDDYLIAIQKKNDGLSPKQKLLMQLVLAIIFFILYMNHADPSIRIPFTNHVITLGFAYFILIVFMFTGASNAVNLTDGMDGLASGVCIIALIPFLVITYMQGKGSLFLLILAIEGALLGYLYFNKKPAKVFMGDTGALALGGLLASLAMITKSELALIFIAGIPVIETVCVIIQQVSVRVFHKRVFVYTPIHYAFRIKGMPETSIVYMFWFVELILAMIGLWIALHS